MRRSALALIGLAWLVTDAATPLAQQGRPAAGSTRLAADLSVLAPTVHPQVPRELSQLWLAPDRTMPRLRPAAVAAVGNAARFTQDGDFSKALTAVSAPGSRDGALGAYAMYFAGVAQLKLKRTADSLASFQALQQQKPIGFLWEAAQLGEADAREAGNEPAAAVAIYQRLLRGRVTDVESVYMRLGRAAEASGDPTVAGDAYSHVYYEFPLGENASAAEDALARLRALPALTPASPRFRADLGRAERLFAARRYGDARSAFDALKAVAADDVADQIQLRLAECDYFGKKLKASRETLLSLASRAPGTGEALYHAGLAARDLGDSATFIKTMQQVDAQFAASTWADSALDSLAAYYVRNDEDDSADALYRRLIERFPFGSHTERAAWKVGWLAFRNGQFDDTARVFERAASTFARSDYRPGWLYWAGRAHERAGRTDLAQDRYALTITDYAHTYYGRLAAKRVDAAVASRLAVAARPTAELPAVMGVMPPNAPTVRALLDAQLFDAALNELRYAQLVWGDSPVLQATTAWIVQQQSATESGMRRLSMLRAGMNGMRRAYPQFMTSGGDAVPRDVLTVIFPLAYWDLIRKHADANGLDPYFVAALVAQESTFVADVRSPANAVGLMQLMPATARMYAKKLKMVYSQRMLTDPESNIRLGTAYLADKMREFGEAHLALASYNAGERPTHRWQDARQGLETDEFIDDIPYPETQGYVKKILGTADDYRRLYTAAAGRPVIDTIPRGPATPAPVATVASAPVTKAPAASAPKPATARKPAARTPARKPAAH